MVIFHCKLLVHQRVYGIGTSNESDPGAGSRHGSGLACRGALLESCGLLRAAIADLRDMACWLGTATKKPE